jgi:predicted Zn-dependent protease
MRSWALLALLLASAAVPLNASAAAGRPPAATLKRDFDNCRAHANLDACYDAVRWNPSDPALLVALGDALAAANRPADALRTYKRAAALAPGMRGLNAKISAIETKLSKHAGNTPPRAAPHSASDKRYSNIAPDSQSH